MKKNSLIFNTLWMMFARIIVVFVFIVPTLYEQIDVVWIFAYNGEIRLYDSFVRRISVFSG